LSLRVKQEEGRGSFPGPLPLYSRLLIRHAVAEPGTRIEVSCSTVAGAFEEGAFNHAATNRKKQMNATSTMRFLLLEYQRANDIDD